MATITRRKFILTNYHRALMGARSLTALYEADKRARHTMRVPAGATAIFNEHVKRIKGTGCEGDCIDVLERISK
jgi:hypothetical protein